MTTETHRTCRRISKTVDGIILGVSIVILMVAALVFWGVI